MWPSNAKWLLRALFMLDRVKRKRNKKTLRPLMYQECWQSGGMFIFQQSAVTHCASAQPPWPVWCVRSSRAFLSLCTALIPGEHVRWNSPPIKTGISQVRCGNRPSVGNRGSVALSFPHRHSASFSLALVHEAASLPCLSHPYCKSSSSLFSPYILSFFFFLSSTFSFWNFQFVSSQLTLFKPHFQKIHFPLFPLSSF